MYVYNVTHAKKSQTSKWIFSELQTEGKILHKVLYVNAHSPDFLPNHLSHKKLGTT